MLSEETLDQATCVSLSLKLKKSHILWKEGLKLAFRISECFPPFKKTSPKIYHDVNQGQNPTSSEK